MSDRTENMIVAGLDQDWAALVEFYDSIDPLERGEIAEWLTDKRGPIHDAPDYVLDRIKAFASVAMLETGLRWSQRDSETVK